MVTTDSFSLPSARKRSHSSHTSQSSSDILEDLHFIDEENLTQLAIKDNKTSFTIQNIACAAILVMSSLFFIVIGMTIGLVLYFSFDAQNSLYLKEVISSNAQLKTSKLQQRINFLTKGCEALVGLIKVKSFSEGLLSYEEFLDFGYEALDIETSSVKIYEYLPYVNNYANLTLFISSVRANSGPHFENYTVTQRDQNGVTITPVMNSPFYFPSLYIFPESELGQNGADIYTIRKSLIDAALSNPSTAITSGKVILLRYQGATAFRMMKAILSKEGDLKGIASIIIMRDQLMIDVSADSTSFNYVVLDKNETNVNNSIVFASPSYNGLPANTLINSLEANPLIVSTIVKFGYRQWQLFAIATGSFIDQNSSAQKWIALFGCIVASFFSILALILCCAIIINVYRTHIMTRSRMRIVLMAQENLKKLINKISNQEQKARFILDSIHDCMLIVNTSSGKIKTANKSFTLVYQYEEEDWKELHITAILPALTQEFFSSYSAEGNQIDETLSRSKAGISYKVTVAQKPIPNNENMSFCLVIIRLLADNSRAFNQLIMKSKTSIYDDTSVELLQKLQHTNSDFYTMFKNFCKQEFTLDTLECVEKIEEYKTIIDVEQRIKMQQEILTTFLTEKAPRQVNVSSKVLQKQRHHLGDGLGHLNSFDYIEKILLETLCLNSYSRFKQMIIKFEQSPPQRSSLISNSSVLNSMGVSNASEEQINSPEPNLIELRNKEDY